MVSRIATLKEMKIIMFGCKKQEIKKVILKTYMGDYIRNVEPSQASHIGIVKFNDDFVILNQDGTTDYDDTTWVKHQGFES